jgi:hypothetical protein
MKFFASTLLLVSLASPSADAFRVPFLNRLRRVFSKPSISTSTVALPLNNVEVVTAVFDDSATSTCTSTSSPVLPVHHVLPHTFPPTPAVPDIVTAMELMCLTNNVNYAATDPGTGVAMIEALLNSLDDQRDIMVDRMEEIAKALPTLQIRKQPPLGQTIITAIREPLIVPASSSNMINSDVAATHWDALSHTDFKSVMNQIPEVMASPSSQQHQQLAIINTLQQERTIAMARMAVIDLSIEQLFIVTSRVDDVTAPFLDEDGNHDVQSLLDSIQNVLLMEQDQSAADAIMRNKGTATEFDYSI